MSDYRIEIAFAEPFFCGSKHAESNEMVSLEFIPGTTLRGSLASELFQAGKGQLVPEWFSRTGPCWTPGLPTPGQKLREEFGEDAFVVPMPLSFLREKSDDEPFEESGVVNSLLVPIPRNEEEYASLAGAAPSIEAPKTFQWTRVGEKWLLVAGRRPAAAFAPGRTASMHAGLHYARQANRDQALFSRSAVDFSTGFLAWVREHPGRDLPISATLGKRRSAGNGLASLTWTEGGFPWLGHGVGNDGKVNIQLISDAIVTDDRGNCLAGLDSAAWSRAIGAPTKVISAASASRRIRAWSVSRGLPGSHMVAIAAGSAYRLEAASDPVAWSAAVNALAEKGLGCLHHEGFGWISINPSWLNDGFVPPRKAAKRQRDPKPMPWPGLENVGSDLVQAALAFARDMKIAKGDDNSEKAKAAAKATAKKFGALAAYASRVEKVADVTTYLKGLAERESAHGWNKIHGLAGPWLEKAASIELARFFLSAVETYHG